MRTELILCFGWLHYQVIKHTSAECSRTEFGVFVTGWLMTLYTIVTLPLAAWVIIQ